MSCDHCTDPDGKPCFPTYGHAPAKWGAGFVSDPLDPRMGTFFCPVCGDGKQDVSPDDEAIHEFRRALACLPFAIDAEDVCKDVTVKMRAGLEAALRVGARYRTEPPQFLSARRPGGPRLHWVHEYPDGTRREVRVFQVLKHLKTGGIYSVTAFPIRESDMKQGFDYVSHRDGAIYWRPIEELFDGRFEYLTSAPEAA